MPGRNVEPERLSLAERVIGWVLSVVAVIMAILLLSLPARFTSPSWQYVLQIPGSYAMWGTALLIFGSLMTASMALRNTVLFVSCACATGVYFVILAAGFTLALIADERANPWGPIVWVVFGGAYLFETMLLRGSK